MHTLRILPNSTVLVRVDYNISNLEELFRIESSKKTILELLEGNKKVILMTHYGRPTNRETNLSTQNLVEVIAKTIGIRPIFVDQTESFKEAKKIIDQSNNKLFLLENTRFLQEENTKDEKIKIDLAKEYATLGKYLIDEAFSVSHRKEVTNFYLKKILSWDFGYRHTLEKTNLDRLKNPQKPFYLILGGAKVETKLPMIENLIDKADKILLGGKICFTFLEFLRRQGETIPPLFDSPFEEVFIPIVGELLTKYKEKIVLPVDLVYKSTNDKTVAGDVGAVTTSNYIKLLEEAKTVFWNGTLGQTEQPSFAYSSTQIAKYLTTLENGLQNTFVVVGGGDTESFLTESQKKSYSFVSTGGGACLDYLSR